MDYVSNTDPNCRTMPDGFDCEVISARLLDWLDKNALDLKYREHVTSMLYEHKPDWAKCGQFSAYIDESYLKISVDTQEDLEMVRAHHEIMQKKIDYMRQKYMGFWRI